MDDGWIFKDGKLVRCDCFKKRIRENKAKKLKMPKEFLDITIDDFKTGKKVYGKDASISTKIKVLARNYVNMYEDFIGDGFYFWSEIKGSGKTFLMAGMGNELMAQNYTVRFAKTIDILNLIKDTFQSDAKEKATQVIEDLSSVDVLLIDDIGVERATDWANEQFNLIIDKRMTSKRTTLFTSNCKIEDLKLDDRIVNRIHRIATPVHFPEVSVRDIISERRNMKNLKKLIKGEGNE